MDEVRDRAAGSDVEDLGRRQPRETAADEPRANSGFVRTVMDTPTDHAGARPWRRAIGVVAMVGEMIMGGPSPRFEALVVRLARNSRAHLIAAVLLAGILLLAAILLWWPSRS